MKTLLEKQHRSQEHGDGSKNILLREQDGGGEGGCGVHLCPRIHQEYTFRHRSACRTAAESRQEHLSSGKEYTEPRKTRWDEGTRQRKECQ